MYCIFHSEDTTGLTRTSAVLSSPSRTDFSAVDAANIVWPSA